MSRPPRKLSNTGLYHIIFRGINRQNIFEEQSDYKKILNIFSDVKKEKAFKIYAYCLMTNHVHLFIEEKSPGDIKKIMHKILTRYVVWYNRKYQRSGSLIGNRYKSEPVEDEGYYFSLVKYIHNNPEKTGLSQNAKDYVWSSYGDYVGSSPSVTDTDFVLKTLSDDIKKAKNKFKLFHEMEDGNDFSIAERIHFTDEQAKRKIKMVLKGKEISELIALSKEERNRIISVLKNKHHLSIRQLERLTGISRGIIGRA